MTNPLSIAIGASSVGDAWQSEGGVAERGGKRCQVKFEIRAAFAVVHTADSDRRIVAGHVVEIGSAVARRKVD